MRRCITMFTVALLVVAGTLSVAFAAAVRNGDSNDRWAQPGRVVVKLVDHSGSLPSPQKTGMSKVDQILARHDVELLRPVLPAQHAPAKAGTTDLRRVFVAHYGGGADPYRVAAELSALPTVEYAEPLYFYTLNVVPNDDDWPSQNLYLGTRMQFPAAWDVVKGEDGNVVVAIIDGGTDWRHIDLVANMWNNSGEIDGNGMDDDNNGFVDDVRGWNFGNNTPDPTGLASTPGSGRHGTHTAGIVCAVANNDTIIAGASWNAKLMALNAGVEGFDGAIGYGYESIIYAASNGADVINMSWGGSGGGPSLFELEVIQFAYEQGSVLVAAAGNGPISADGHYPSAYPHVMSVTNVSFNDVKAFTANFGVTVDVSAQGQSIWSTFPNNSAASLSGTSMSSPHAAAVCALVKTQHPEYNPDQVMQQVRLTSDDIDNLNSVQWRGLLGRGRVNASRAVTENTPALQVSNIEFDDPDGDGVLEPGETVSINLEITNLLAPAQNMTFSLSETSQYVTITSGAQQLSSLGTLEKGVISFSAQIAANAPENSIVQATLDIAAGIPVFNDIARMEFVIQPVFVNHTVNNVATTVSSVGRYGFASALGGNGSDGIGFAYKGGPKVLFEGAMMIGASASSLIDAARGARPDGTQEADFGTRTDGTPHFIASQPLADEQSLAVFGSSSRDPLYVTVRQDVYGFASAPDDDYLLFRYEITNESTLAISGMFVGWFNDWDIGGVGETPPYLNDFTDYDGTRGLGYSYDGAGDADGAYFGNVIVSNPGTTSFTGILNDEDILGNPWGIYDGFTKSEKWLSISQGIQRPAVGPEDVAYSISTGPVDLAPGQSVIVAMAYVAGDDLTDLQTNADRAVDKWNEIADTTPVALLDLQAIQQQEDVVISWRTGTEKDVLGYQVFRSRDGGVLQAVGSQIAPNGDREYEFRDASPGVGTFQYRIAEVTVSGNILLSGSANIEVLAAVPSANFIAPNAPNPFNPRTTLSYGLAQGGPVRLRVFDGRGRLVRTLENTPYRAPGFYSVTWDGVDDGGKSVASGVYMARLEFDGRVLTRRMTLLK